MPLLSSQEAFHVSDSFLISLYGEDLFKRWRDLKEEMQFGKESEYVNWLIDVANHYKNHEQQRPACDNAAEGYWGDMVKSECTYDEDCPVDVHTGLSDAAHSPLPQRTRSEINNLSSEQRKLVLKRKLTICGDEESMCEEKRKKEPKLAYDIAGDGVNISSNDIILSSDDDYPDECSPNIEKFTDDPTNDLSNMDDDNQPVMNTSKAEGTCKRFTCKYCAYRTNDMSSLKKHTEAVHYRQKPYSCEFCNYQSAQKVDLNSHLVSKHGYQSNYCCKSCGKYFFRPNRLWRHESTCSTREIV